ncbi:hypothetical protein HIM_07501 [Hirsutella minnesotensis 3608]|uniref:Uncharacterized protein n=1 Tax=Hirsutella minnesotensis 3608 TaxID=1043627 RepID=A0A0F7ZYV2_9HYPO|nr:hypothetical protein HIM_07501 [Hirsutella minnesotensis 3608]
MRSFFTKCLQFIKQRWRPRTKSVQTGHVASPSSNGGPLESDSDDYIPSPAHYPVFPPLSPSAIIDDPETYWSRVQARKFAAPQGYFQDSSLFALYRLYEFIVLDRVFAYRNALEAFWRQRDWKIQDVADPCDNDAQRYAFLAGCTYLLVRSFNQRVKLGLRRDNPPLITPEEAEEARSVPQELRPWEAVPSWAQSAPPLKETLSIPTHDGEMLESAADTRADPDFLAKNILLWTPHIFFT